MTGPIQEPGVLKQVFDQTMAVMALFGAGGGLANALVTKAPTKEIIRLIAIGSLLAGGLGALSPLILRRYIPDLDTDLAGVIGIVAGCSFIVGSFGSAGFELILNKLGGGKDDV